jgi:hypothetical protein
MPGNACLLSSYYMPGRFSPGDTAVNESKFPALPELVEVRDAFID